MTGQPFEHPAAAKGLDHEITRRALLNSIKARLAVEAELGSALVDLTAARDEIARLRIDGIDTSKWTSEDEEYLARVEGQRARALATLEQIRAIVEDPTAALVVDQVRAALEATS